jgi:hypothetical protein
MAEEEEGTLDCGLELELEVASACCLELGLELELEVEVTFACCGALGIDSLEVKILLVAWDLKQDGRIWSEEGECVESILMANLARLI